MRVLKQIMDNLIKNKRVVDSFQRLLAYDYKLDTRDTFSLLIEAMGSAGQNSFLNGDLRKARKMVRSVENRWFRLMHKLGDENRIIFASTFLEERVYPAITKFIKNSKLYSRSVSRSYYFALKGEPVRGIAYVNGLAPRRTEKSFIEEYAEICLGLDYLERKTSSPVKKSINNLLEDVTDEVPAGFSHREAVLSSLGENKFTDENIQKAYNECIHNLNHVSGLVLSLEDQHFVDSVVFEGLFESVTAYNSLSLSVDKVRVVKAEELFLEQLNMICTRLKDFVNSYEANLMDSLEGRVSFLKRLDLD